MIDVLVTMPFGQTLLDRLRAVSPSIRLTQAEPESADYSAVDVLYANAPCHPELAPNLKWVQLHLAGVDGIRDHPIYAKSAVPLTTTSGVHAAATAEYALMAMLALAHRVPRMIESKDRGAWPPDQQRWPLFVPTELRGATVGIIGYGSIGREVARLTKSAFNMTVLACKRDPATRADPGYYLLGTGDPDGVLPDGWFSQDQLQEMLRLCDVVVMCAPLTSETHRMLGAAEFRAMKPSAFFINVGRGSTVDEEALAKALSERRLQAAALDVFVQEPLPAGHPFYALDNVILSPHVSGFLPSYDEKCTELFVENLRRFIAGEALINLVDRSKGY